MWEFTIFFVCGLYNCMSSETVGIKDVIFILGLGWFGFFSFGSIQFSFQSQVLGFIFFWFRYLHITTMQEYPSV